VILVTLLFADESLMFFS